jgi:hypothetical protein
MKTNAKKRLAELNKFDSARINGGRLWPFFNLEEIMSQICYGEDLSMLDFIKK